ncbi:MAG: hypothetical protein J0H01_00480 [Rhizobiales bacterium]|nr:hypothetical protein [Hyphomicrobiales bacterium]
MELVDRAYEMAVLYRATAQRMRISAGAISPELASGLSVFKSYKETLTQNVATLEDYCSTAERFKRIRDFTCPSGVGRGG